MSGPLPVKSRANRPRHLVPRKVWVAVLVLLIAGVIAIVIPPILGALRAHTDAGFVRWTGWATLWTAPLTVLLAAITFVCAQISRSSRAFEQGSLTAKDEHPPTTLTPRRPLVAQTHPVALKVHP